MYVLQKIKRDSSVNAWVLNLLLIPSEGLAGWGEGMGRGIVSTRQIRSSRTVARASIWRLLFSHVNTLVRSQYGASIDDDL